MTQRDTLCATRDCCMRNIHACLSNAENHNVLALSKVLSRLELGRVDDLGDVFDARNCDH